ncbi:MAG: thioredoxin domain-containing protein [Candidatus Solibacter usitatus]|nr:thioredoxin domain-containing protein [Candidatus Solibacter usitatus]
MRKFYWLCLLGAMCMAASAQTKKAAPAKPLTPVAASPAKTAFDKAHFSEYLRHLFLIPEQFQILVDDPTPSDMPSMLDVNVKVTDGGANTQQVSFYVSKDGTKAMQGKVFDLRDSPFAADTKLLKIDGSPVAGPANAAVSIFVYSDFQCQYCKEEAKTLRANLEKSYPTQVKLIFKDFPLEKIHPWAKPAAIIGRCVQKQDPAAFWGFHDWIFEQQPQITAENLKTKSLEYAGGKKLDTLLLGQCIDGKMTEKDVEASAEQARALQVNSTPTLFVNGRRLVGNVAWDQLKSVIDHEIEYAKKAKQKEEACCEVKLPIPGGR